MFCSNCESNQKELVGKTKDAKYYFCFNCGIEDEVYIQVNYKGIILIILWIVFVTLFIMYA